MLCLRFFALRHYKIEEQPCMHLFLCWRRRPLSVLHKVHVHVIWKTKHAMHNMAYRGPSNMYILVYTYTDRQIDDR